VHLSLSVFVGLSFDKSFKIFVGEGHDLSLAEFLAVLSGVLFEAVVNC